MKRYWLAPIFVLVSTGAAQVPSSLQALVWGETWEETARRTHYTVAELKKYFPPVKLDYEMQGFAKERFAPPPKPYLHPRIFFNPEDVPGLRRALKETGTGRQIWNNLNAQLDAQLRNPVTAQGKLYAQLVAGNSPVLKDAGSLMTLLAHEAYRCLIADDKDGGQKLAMAMTSAARSAGAQLATVNPTYRWQDVAQSMLGGDGLGRAYDLAYNFMDDTQRRTVRATLSAGTKGKWGIGMDNVPAWEANMMNWSPWITGQLLISSLAIEGEEGYDATIYPRMAQMYRQLMTLGFFESGAGYEGMAKNSPCLYNLIPLAKRGDPIIASTHALSFIRKFRLGTMEPWGHYWLEEGNWGGTDTRGHLEDYAAMKWAFPNDPVVDLQFRSAMELPGALKGLSYAEMFPSDWKGQLTWDQQLERTTKDTPLTFFCKDVGELATRSGWDRNAALLYFVPRNLLDGHRHAARNMFVYVALGRVWGDYTKLAGGNFEGDITESSYHSVPLIDDRGQAIGPPAKFVALVDTPEATFGVGDARLAYSVRRSRPGEASLELHPNDFRLEKSPLPWMDLPWKDLPDWYSGQKLGIGTVRIREYRGEHGFDPATVAERTWERAWTLRDKPVRKAFRTAGLVRGKHNYALIVDDIQKDDQPHQYKWLMQTADDLELEAIKVSENGAPPAPELQNAAGPMRGKSAPVKASYMADFLLREGKRRNDGRVWSDEGPANRELLVRVLENQSVAPAGKVREEMGNRYDFTFGDDQPVPVADGRPGSLETYLRYARSQQTGKRLVIPSRAVSPDFKVLLFAHRVGEALPMTRWNASHTTLSVEWGDQKDEYVFQQGSDGRTRFSLSRDGRKVLSLD